MPVPQLVPRDITQTSQPGSGQKTAYYYGCSDKKLTEKHLKLIMSLPEQIIPLLSPGGIVNYLRDNCGADARKRDLELHGEAHQPVKAYFVQHQGCKSYGSLLFWMDPEELFQTQLSDMRGFEQRLRLLNPSIREVEHIFILEDPDGTLHYMDVVWPMETADQLQQQSTAD